MKKFWGSAAMLTATVLWGVAFSAQSRGMDFIGPVLFTALRSMVGVFSLVLVAAVFDLVQYKKITLWGDARSREEKQLLLHGGFRCGIVITFASIAQQWRLKYTTAGKTGFLTALYIIIIPLLGLFFKRKPSPLHWVAAFMALGGSYLLCGGISSIGRGELLVILCACLYSVHIMVIDHYAPHCDCVRLSALQFMIASILAGVFSLILGEPWQGDAVLGAMPFWLFCGVGSSAIAFTLQMVSQKYLHPVTATLLMSLESVFAVLGSWIFLHEILTPGEFAGCAVIFAAVIISQCRR